MPISYVRQYILPVVFAPGIVIHEFAHYLSCVLLGVPVGDVTFFRFGNPAGYVEHQVPRSYTKRILITFAPLLVNMAVAVGTFWWSTRTVLPYSLLAVYVGVTVVAKSLPSSIDAKNLFPHSRLGYVHPLFLLSLPLIFLLLLLNRLRPYRFQLFYTIGVSALLLSVFFPELKP